MKQFVKSAHFLILLLTYQFNLYAQTPKINQIDSLMKWSHKNGVFNGNVLVSQNDKIIYKSSFGFADETKTKNLTAKHKFNIGSITKEFSAVALLQLQEQGKLNLEDKVSKFLPELPIWANEVTINHLLQYTSGIPNVNWKKIKNNEDLYNGLKLIDTLNFKSGTKYDYNNNNIFLRQFIIERLTGIPFKMYAEDFLFKPNKMHSSVLTPFENVKNIAKGYNNNLIPDKIDLPITGGTYLTSIDLLRWSNNLHAKKIINNESVYKIGQQFDFKETQSALGNAKYQDKRLVEHKHHGRAGSYEAILVSSIDEEITIILLTNNYNGKVHELSDKIFKILRDKKYAQPNKKIQK